MSPDADWVAKADGLLGSAAERYLLPLGWAWASLGALGKWMGGGTPSKSEAAYWANGSIPWVSPKDMKTDIIRDTEDHITETAVASSATKFVAPGSVLMVMRSGILRHTFPVAVNEVRVTLNQDLRALAPAENIEPRYVAHYLRHVQRQVLHDCSKDGTTVQSVEVSALERVRVPLAPLPEQRRIVARIDELFAEIAEGEAALERARYGLYTWRQALLKAAVTGELTRDWREANSPTETSAHLLARIRVDREASGARSGRGHRAAAAEPLDMAVLPELPRGWRWCRLADVIVAGPTNGYSPKKSKDGVGSLALKLTATTRGSIDLSDRAIKRLTETIQKGSDLFLRPGDLLFQRGNTIEYVGIAAVYEGPQKTYIYPDLMIRVRTSNRTLARWIWRVANSHLGRKYMQDNATGTAGTMPKINGEILRKFVLPLPPCAEIVEILRLIAQGIEAINDIEERAASYQKAINALRQSILKAAFVGRLVPQDPADEPASALLTRLRGGDAVVGAVPRRRRQARGGAQGALAL